MHDNMISTEIKSKGWRKLMDCGLGWLLFNANTSNISAISWRVGCLSDHIHMQYVVNCLSDHMHMQYMYVSYLLIYFIGISNCFILVMIYTICEINSGISHVKYKFFPAGTTFTQLSVLSVVPCVTMNTHTSWHDCKLKRLNWWK
jgi:hypothetical protein